MGGCNGGRARRLKPSFRVRDWDSRLHVDIVIRDDLPYSVLRGYNLQKSRAESSFVIPRYARSALGDADDRCQSLDNRDIRTDEFERDDVLAHRSILEYAFEDHFMLLDERRMPGEKLASDVCERARLGEMAAANE